MCLLGLCDLEALFRGLLIARGYLDHLDEDGELCCSHYPTRSKMLVDSTTFTANGSKASGPEAIVESTLF